MDVARAEEEMRRLLAETEANAARYQDMHQQVSTVSATERSLDGLVLVTVDANGVPTKLWIAERARDMPASRLSAEIMATMRAAQSKITDQVAQVMRDTIGHDEATAGALLQTYRDRFPEAQPESATPAPPSRPARQADDEEEGWGERPIIT
jgi:DNA-binding protein YbaB